MNPSMKLMFDSIADAVLVVGRDGRVKFSNRSAASMLNAIVGEPVPAPVLARAVREVVGGYVSMPHKVLFTMGENLADSDRLSAQLMPAPVGDDLVAVIRNETQAALYSTAIDNFLSLIRQELQQPMLSFSADLQQVTDAMLGVPGVPPKLMEKAGEMARSGAKVAGRVSKLADLAVAFGGEPMVSDERLLLDQIVTEAARRAQPVAHERGVRLLLPEPEGVLPAIYGSRRWLVRAIDEFIENAMFHAARNSNIVLHLSRAETFVRMSVNNAGKVLDAAQAERAFIAFGKPAAASNDRGRIGKLGMGIGLALARRIVELHGGNVSVHGEAEFGSTFVIELPTGAPGKEDTQLNLEQAKRYAADMSRLLKRRAGKAPAASAASTVASVAAAKPAAAVKPVPAGVAPAPAPQAIAMPSTAAPSPVTAPPARGVQQISPSAPLTALQ